MTRKEFLEMAGILGLGVSAVGLTGFKAKDSMKTAADIGSVIVVGAGVGGLNTAYLLNQLGVDIKILEASSVWGGRIKDNIDLADFPIPLGAEWIETELDVFDRMVNDKSVKVVIETVRDNPDYKFVGYSWYRFFAEFVVPSIKDKIRFDSPVTKIDYASNQVKVVCGNQVYRADKVVLAVPLKMLQDKRIQFNPKLGQTRMEVIEKMPIWSGFKAFFKFGTRFYEDEYVFKVKPKSDGEKIYYDAAFGQRSHKHILGLFAVGKPAQEFTGLKGEVLRDVILAELDGIYKGQASKNYLGHVVQNWDAEPYIGAGYLSDHAHWRNVQALGEPIGNSLYFAGGAFTDGEDWVSVHAAAQSAQKVLKQLLG